MVASSRTWRANSSTSVAVIQHAFFAAAFDGWARGGVERVVHDGAWCDRVRRALYVCACRSSVVSSVRRAPWRNGRGACARACVCVWGDPYLGLVFTSNGKFHQTQLTLASQASKAMFSLYKRLSQFVNLKPDFMLDMLDKFISQVLNYGCEIWGFHAAPNIETVALRYYKNILGCRQDQNGVE